MHVRSQGKAVTRPRQSRLGEASMDERIEELYKVVLSEQGKPLGEMRREVR
jgi:hypothetical protein